MATKKRDHKHDSVSPLLDGGYVWIGGWYNIPQGKFEVNVTLVIGEQYRDEVVMFGQDWDQYRIWDFGYGCEIETGGSGRVTLYAADNPVWQ